MDEPTGADTPESAPQPEADLASRLDELASRISLEAEADEATPLGSEDPLGETYDWQAGSAPSAPATDADATGVIPVITDETPEPAAVADEPASGAPVNESVSSELAAELTEMRSSIEERMAVLEDTLQSVCERIESLARDGISVTGEGIEKLADGVRALEARVASLPVTSGEGSDAPAAPALDVPALASAVTESLSATMGTAFNDLATAVGLSLREHTDSVSEALAATRSIELTGGSGVSGDIDSDALIAAVEGVSGRVDEGHELIATLATGVGESLRAHAEHLNASLDGTRIAVEMAVSAALQAANLAAPDGGPVLGTLESPLTRAEMAEALGEIAVRLLEGQEVIADRVDFVQGHLVNDANLRDTQHQSLAQALVAMSTASADADEVIVAEAMRTTASLEAVFNEMQAQRGLLAAVVNEVRRSIQAVDGSLGSVATSLVGYLAERDRLLELERADVQREMLVGFASGLKQADRKRAVSRISSALDQRADSRDAQKWRDAITDPVPPSAPDIDDVATLHDLLDRFEAGEAVNLGASDPLIAALDEFPIESSAPAKRPAKATAKATKTAAKTPAKKAPAAKKAPVKATKTPAKKAPAKRPPAAR